MLIGVSNQGESAVFVQEIAASFRYPQEISFHVANFTKVSLNATIPAKHQATFAYTFRPDPNYDPRTFVFVLTVGLVDEAGTPYIQSVYNSTVEIVDSRAGMSGELFFVYLATAAVGLLVVYLAYNTFSGGKAGKTRKTGAAAPQAEMGTNQEIKSEWIADIVNTKTSKQKTN